MPEYKLVILGEITDFNTYSTAERTHRNLAADLKFYETNRVRMEAMHQKLGVCEKYPLDIHFHWYLPNKKKDPDNIAAAKKFILDGLQGNKKSKTVGFLVNDGWGQIAGFRDSFHIDAEKPRVEVEFYVVQ
jgi:hypothetical protein